MAEVLIREYDDDRDRRAVVGLWNTSDLTRPWNDPDADIDRKLAVADSMFLVAHLIDAPSTESEPRSASTPTLVGSVMAGYDGHRGWINYLAVDPGHRGSGLGARLMAEAERRLAAQGCAKVNLQVRQENDAAIAFYERLGYRADDVASLGKRLVHDSPPAADRAVERIASLGPGIGVAASRTSVPDVVVNKARAHGADDWLRDLPDLLRSLELDWGLRFGRVHRGGTEAFVVDADTIDGRRAVLKLLVPRPGAPGVEGERSSGYATNEIDVLRRIGGDGCAELIRNDEARGALLLERLGPSLNDLGTPIDERHRILCSLAARVWRPAPGADLPTGAEKAVWLVEHINHLWDELGRPCSVRAVEHAIDCAERRGAAHDDERAVVNHGDVHEWNALADPERPGEFKLVDPDGLLAEPEYDLGVIMREDPIELLAEHDPHARARRLAALVDRLPDPEGRRSRGMSVEAIVEWGVVERLSTGLLATKIKLEPVGRHMLVAAEYVAGRPR